MNVKFIPGHTSLKGWHIPENFGGWLACFEGRNFLIDCGVGTGAEDLARRLREELDGRRLDFILLTHIHLDHAGGLGPLVRDWPEAKVLVHAAGLRHLVAPARLWAGTQQVMKETAEFYGQPWPVEESRFIAHNEADIPGLRILATPGHAPHHLSFILGETMFAGEALGSPKYYQRRFCMRPATPPQYFPEETLASIELLAREPECRAYLAHVDEPCPYHESIELCKKQLRLWDEILRRPSSALKEGESRPDYLDRLCGSVLAEDPYYMPVETMAPPDRAWEWSMMHNCLEGFLGHYERLRAAERKDGHG